MFGMKAAVGLALLSGVEGARIAKRSSCGAKGGSTRSSNVSMNIVNGDPADECEWKWQVSFWSGSQGPYCGGTLIDPEWVFTAAHCGDTPGFDVIAGDYDSRDVSSKQQKRKAKAVWNHPNYNAQTTDYDFSLIKLETPFDLGACVGTACLPEDGDISPGSTCWITGWGTLSSGGRQPAIMQEASVKILSNSQCRATDYSNSDITDVMLCAQGRTSTGKITDACQGDSGGPLVCESSPGSWTLYGATSWGYGCAGANYPGVWARVNKVLDWAHDVMDGKIAEPEPDNCPYSWCSNYCWYGPCKECKACR